MKPTYKTHYQVVRGKTRQGDVYASGDAVRKINGQWPDVWATAPAYRKRKGIK